MFVLGLIYLRTWCAFRRPSTAADVSSASNKKRGNASQLSRSL